MTSNPEIDINIDTNTDTDTGTANIPVSIPTEDLSPPTDQIDPIPNNDQVFEDPEHNSVETEMEEVPPRPVYEVVFFAKYKHFPRPSPEELTNYFSTYGEVHHVVCPMNAIFAFIFMTKLSIDAELRRTRTTISQIIKDMDPNNRFHITVASNKRSGPRTQSPRNPVSSNGPDASDNSNLVPQYENVGDSNSQNRGRGHRGSRGNRGNRGRGRGQGRGDSNHNQHVPETGIDHSQST